MQEEKKIGIQTNVRVAAEALGNLGPIFNNNFKQLVI